ncbi:carboxyl-terminal protease [Verrucomicrobia bacterium LW23]|nr:carboxyl-terminal protease [Verrucomicrobia bacterium LW23]
MRRWCGPLGLLFTAIAVNCLLGFHAWYSDTAEAKVDESYKNTLLLQRVIELVRQEYVDPTKTSYKDLTYSALKGILSSLDPHSQFLDEESFAEMQKDTRGEFSGLGIVVGMRDGNVIIIAPMEDTPSSRAGILPGDRILKIDGKTTEKMGLNRAIKRLRGSRGEKVKMTLMRSAEGKPDDVFDVELTREIIKVATVKEVRLLPAEMTGTDKIGYIRLEQFGENSPMEMERALARLESQGMEALVLDLRNNPGGLLDSAVEIAGAFLPPNTVVVSTQGRTPQQSYEYRSRNGRRHPNYPITVLINGYSASAAEIVAGALKDMRRALILGETSFGKGSVQSVQDLGNGVGLRLTTARYYTPSRKTIHEVGIAPDIYAPVTEKEERQLVAARNPRLLTSEEQTQIRTLRDTQLDRAVASLKGVRIHTQRQNGPDYRARQARNTP